VSKRASQAQVAPYRRPWLFRRTLQPCWESNHDRLRLPHAGRDGARPSIDALMARRHGAARAAMPENRARTPLRRRFIESSIS
jgi:hypothetical protein